MNISKHLFDEIEKISKDERFNYFFDNMEKEMLPEEKELFDKLTDIASKELEISYENKNKLKYIMFLSFWSKKAWKSYL